MDTAIIVITVFLVVITGIVSGLLVYGLINDIKAQAATVPAEETKATEVSPAEAASGPAASSASTVLALGPALTHEEKYKELTDTARGWYDEIAAYAAAVEGAKRSLTKRYEEYSIGHRKLVRLTVKRGFTVCEFIIQNNDLLAYSKENQIEISTTPTILKINDEVRVAAAKHTVDLVVKNINEEKAIRRRLANERRKMKNEQDKNEQDKENNNEGEITE